MNYEILYTFVLATAALAITPGPDNIYVLMQGVAHGKKYGLATVAGLLSGCLVHTSLLAFGVSAILRENERLFLVIKILGALYLFYLAYKVLNSETNSVLSDDIVPKKGVWSLFKQGFVMNVLNPKVALFFLAFFPGFLFSENLGTAAQFFVLGLLFIVVSFFVFGLITLLAGTISDVVRRNKDIARYLKWFQIFVFVGIGVFILLSNN
ncbi:LysE family translocator [uncultured Kriegella sp.]|uniref:LysE family translocator n=1 Tax=uncultured Kriegella sp. TaxID=1798910 RepID=UPI0030D78A02